MVFPCLACEFETSQKSALTKHIIVSHEDMIITCQECPISNCEHKPSLKSDIKELVDSIHVKRTFSCAECDYKSTSKKSMHKDMSSIHE